MTIHELKEKFVEKRSYAIEDACQLLDFAKQTYINNEISLKEFRNVIRELEEIGAQNIDVFFESAVKAEA
ncbi:YppF family protein [Siminovitchia sediminis]|uniref:YppF family protein n=1 Tax=Siminovitchia sediminis TaxID=1274353 RepID=A0ABW4KIT5_9BACI